MKNMLKSDLTLGDYTPNVGRLFLDNCTRFAKEPAFAQRVNGDYRYWSWEEFTTDIIRFSYFLQLDGLKPRDRVTIISTNSYLRAVVEMAVMASGMVSVPIFFGYPLEKMSDLIQFSDSKMLIIENEERLQQLADQVIPPSVLVLSQTARHLHEFQHLTVGNFQEEAPQLYNQMISVVPTEQLLIMYTSGTGQDPKGVMLTHQNILSQQRALELLWKLPSGLRFLCYLPWHHSFGGLFERFLAFYNGGCLAIDDSMGKDSDRLFDNFSKIKPHIYFSIPRVYQEIIARVMLSEEHREIFFHENLKFVFTAAAPLPISTSDVFKENHVPVVEGWGLTETSPCCTLTEQKLDRTPGVVGSAIPEVEVKVIPDGEILVRGPNIMLGYFKRDDLNVQVFDQQGWFRTGDIGEIGDEGLKIISRKDRIFKLSNAEKVYPVAIEENVRKKCSFIKFIYVCGSGQAAPLALIFPNLELLNASHENLKLEQCKKPEGAAQFASCIKECVRKLNDEWPIKYEKVKQAIVINRELSIEREELTPSMKLVPRIIERNYKEYINSVVEGRVDDLGDDAYYVQL
ncbi:MAG: AMP-binding protein [Bdellovibrionales bacterium]|jgi:long-subunit acyl-CoA synthetase (AMP-forming)|nr:AMP-binding protein [Bdellovibrionales bacterium]MBT3526189.1 AMP-binding protein [Bdellovibrionales bacterium]MBT7667963.1 AMP-binding protein [Bdellovibrionales bacterium]